MQKEYVDRLLEWVPQSQDIALRSAATELLAMLCSSKDVGDTVIATNVGVCLVCVRRVNAYLNVSCV